MKTLGQTGCPECLVFRQCGGHPFPIIYRLGCANFAHASAPVDTDDMNPAFAEKFWKLWRDTDGLFQYSIGPLRSMNADGLPRYIPVVQNRHLLSAAPLAVDTVAIPLFKIFGRLRSGGYGARFQTAKELRDSFGLRHDARIILVGVDKDPPLETFWAKHQRPGVLASLASLGLEVTVPNYSFFTCVPRFQILRNRKRILLASERISQAGVRVSVHLNANTEADWEFWQSFLAEHAEVTCVTVEFQTGALLDQEFGMRTFQHLVNIQNRLGRRLHFLLVGAARFYPRAVAELRSFSLIDSRPFICAQKRKMLDKSSNGDYVWKNYPTRKGATLASLFEHNLKCYREMIKQGLDDPKGAEPENKEQVQFSF
ncbi:MAG: uncharacterized protein JWM16_3470 [Verrucomicrobiales bacterium]|nr:uncharacterized protein [Verrucomicrobiales bacterium]